MNQGDMIKPPGQRQGTYQVEHAGEHTVTTAAGTHLKHECELVAAVRYFINVYPTGCSGNYLTRADADRVNAAWSQTRLGVLYVFESGAQFHPDL